MQHLGGSTESCPFSFNFEPSTFKVGDMVSYRIPERFEDFPFVGTLVEVHADYVMISTNDPTCPELVLKGTREARPVVDFAQLPSTSV
ncbi:hypothetical protein [Pseudomonas borbori]|uniref:Uncharacterized protein n=1 Tax=Pseudomonas borbori TaxID=289003 RepID=A0A1I5XDR3_9PSED|nr:hypothetical protein [Pseudomonas borbori]SFQ30024.1 hypothetical protein SAMN05216190_1568 [Pseudomonas borbori]